MPLIRSSRGRRRRRLPNRWTAQIGDGIDVGTASVVQEVLVGSGDYASNTGIEPGSKVWLSGIRGYVTVVPTVTTAFTLWLAILALDVDANTTTLGAGTDPSAVQNAIDERMLWWFSYRFAATAAATPMIPKQFEIHSKSRVKLQDTIIVMSAVCSNAVAGVNCELFYNTRSNIQGFPT